MLTNLISISKKVKNTMELDTEENWEGMFVNLYSEYPGIFYTSYTVYKTREKAIKAINNHRHYRGTFELN